MQTMQTQPEMEARSWKEVIADIVHDIENIFRNELRLAALEVKGKLKQSASAGGLLAAAGLLGFFGLACLIVTAIVALNIVLALWLSALIIGVLLLIAAGVAYFAGRAALRKLDPMPQKTVQTLKDNLEWGKAHVAS